MGRNKKYDAEYFLHSKDFRNNLRIKALRQRFGPEGYGIICMLFEVLISHEHFIINLQVLDVELLAGDFGIDSGCLNEILEYCIKLRILRIDGDMLSSPLLDDYLTYLKDYRTKKRHQKQKTAQNADTDNPTNRIFAGENEDNGCKNDVFAGENALSKGKVSKDKVSKDKNSKEKGEKESPPEKIEENSGFEKKEENNGTVAGQVTEPGDTTNYREPSADERKKVAQKKESPQQADLPRILITECKAVFLNIAEGYYWESNDTQHLENLLYKLTSSYKLEKPDRKLVEYFKLFLSHLPAYWRTKKFTIPLINQNYNEILNEIRSTNKPVKTESHEHTEKHGRFTTDDLTSRARRFAR